MFKKIQHNNQAYHYSQCAKNDFLSNWYKKRNIIKVELQKIKDKKNSAFKKIKKSNDFYNSENIFKRLIHELEIGVNSNNKNKIEIWIKKFEVFGRFYNNYESDLKRKKYSRLASLDCYFFFGECLSILLMKQKNEIRYISTFLKLLDMLCEVEKHKLSTENLNKLISFINLEINLIKNLDRNING